MEYCMSLPVVCIADSVEVPLNVRTLRAFRRWAFSPDFPQSGRIDYIGGRIAVDMSPERAFTHGSPKVELIRVLGNYLNQQDVGLLFSDRMRVTSLEADLSAEPDLVFVSYTALQEGRVAFDEPTKRAPRDFLELRGAPDLVVEILSPGSIRKDTRDLPPRYFTAGVREFWLVDALRTPFRFQVFGRGPTRFMARRRDQLGFQPSAVLGVKVLMEQRTTARGFPGYRLTFR
jgi:Uma2 family endonuclease